MNILSRSFLFFILVIISVVLTAGCTSGGSSSAPVAQGQAKSLQLSGLIDPSTMIAMGKPPMWQRFLASLSIKEAYATMLPGVNKVIAISNDKTMVSGTISGNFFSVLLEKGKPYLLVFLNNTNIIGIYKVDAALGLDTFPLNSKSSGLYLGTVSLAGSVLSGTVSETETLTTLAIDSSIASAFGVMDDGFLRLSSLDVDGNGEIDMLEGKQFDLYLDYEFSSGQTFTDLKNLSALGSFSTRTTVIYKGYEYYFSAYPDQSNLYTWETTTATMTAPAAITDSWSGLTGTTVDACWNPPANGNKSLNFYCGGSSVAPATPPPGDYTVTVGKTALAGGGTQTFMFHNVRSQTIDGVNLYNIYIPEIRLTTSNGQIALIEWRWWKKTATSGWVQPTEEELSTVLQDASFEIADSGWNLAGRVSGHMALTTTGSVVPGAQSITPAKFRVSTFDKAGYNYGFEWQ